MIIGIGIDLLKVNRIKKVLDKYGDTFLNKVFTDSEISNSNRFFLRENKFAKCFSTKEAFVKALGVGFKEGISYKDISLKNKESGQPYLGLSNNVKRFLSNKTPKGYKSQIDVTISDDKDYVISNVVISFIKSK